MKIPYSLSSSIGPTIIRYIALKQSLGRKYTTEYKILKNLDAFLDRHQSEILCLGMFSIVIILQH